MDFLNWYKRRIESNEQEPPEFIWKNIQDEFDVNQSWNRINNYLDVKASARRRRYLGIAASVVILLASGAFWVLNNEKGSDPKTIKEQKALETEKEEMFADNISQENETTPVESGNFNITRAKTKQEVPVKAEQNFLQLPSADVEENQDVQVEKSPALRMNSKEIETIEFDQEKLLAENFEIDDKRNVSEGSSAFRKLYLGVTGQVTNTWLLNEKTYTGLESSSLTSSNASYGSNFGIYLGTNLSTRIDLQLDFIFLSNINQNYNEYLNGKYIENSQKFKYSQLALSFRYYFMSKRFMQGEHGINLGGYYGYLYNSYQILDGETIDRSSEYANTDYGVFLSYEYVIPVGNKLGLGVGARAVYGLKNIYAGNEDIPSYLNITHNASLNITLSLKYNLK